MKYDPITRKGSEMALTLFKQLLTLESTQAAA